MRHLFLLRHAHAEPAVAGQDDLDRPLSPTGRAEAEAAGRWLRKHEAAPDRVLCSPARRTRETAEALLAGLADTDLRWEPRIYEASPGELIGLLQEHAEPKRLWLVGHNPGLEQLLALLVDGRSAEVRGLPPGAIAWLKVPKEGPLEPATARLRAFWSP